MRIALVALLSSGCIAATVKAHTGVVADDRGRGVQAGVSLGFGVAGKRSAVVETVGFAGGQSPKAGLALGLDYVRFPEHGYGKRGIGWRVGIGGVPLAYGEPAMTGVRVASLFLIRDRYRNDGHEKSWSESTRSIRAIGVEAMVGAMTHGQFSDMPETTLGGAASVTFEWYSLSRIW